MLAAKLTANISSASQTGAHCADYGLILRIIGLVLPFVWVLQMIIQFLFAVTAVDVAITLSPNAKMLIN